MFDDETTVRSRELGFELTKAMWRRGLRDVDVADLLRWSPSRVSRLLGGGRGAKLVDVAAILAICGVVGARREELLALAEDADLVGWCKHYTSIVPGRERTLANHEPAASVITGFHATLVPALFQTPAYLRALLSASPVVPAEEVDTRVAAGMRRQLVLEGNQPAAVRYYVGEYALTRTGPGPVVMSAQLGHLRQAAARPHVEVRVVPEVGGAPRAEPFQLMEFPDWSPVVYLEHASCAMFIERTDSVTAYRTVLSDLDRTALDPIESRAWLEHAVGQQR